jgi:DNA-binding NtrC family response regulator
MCYHNLAETAHSIAVGTRPSCWHFIKSAVEMREWRHSASMSAAGSASKALPAIPAATGAPKDRVLIVEGEKENCELLRNYLEDKGYETATAGTCALAEQVWRAGGPDVAILDYSLPDGNALDLIPRLNAINASIPIIILTGYGSIDLAVEAVKLGAECFLPKPAELSTLHVMLERSLENQRNHRRQVAEKTAGNCSIPDPFLGESDGIRRIADLAKRAALCDTPVLIQGETGTGKGTLARWLHQNGPRAGEPFVDLNCGGLSASLLDAELFGDSREDAAGGLRSRAGLLEIAHKGTIFFEGIENIDSHVQSKLVQSLEENQFRRLGESCDRRVDLRLIAATRQITAQPALHQRLRGDLYYRVGWIPLSVPPLRERVEDIPALSAFILGELNAALGTSRLEIGGVALEALQAYSWPGNIRELRNVLERVALVARNERLTDQDLDFDLQVEQYLTALGQFRTLEEMERNYIQQVLLREHGRVQAAARKLGIPRSSLYYKLKQYKADQSRMRRAS